MNAFLHTLRTQRWDDHRYYHHSRVNQSLHLLSALAFVVAYAYLLIDPVVSAYLAWLVAMVARQAGHFFFEPLGYDEVNQATHEHKEAIKVGYNLSRKLVLLGVWVLIPAVVYYFPQALNWAVPVADQASGVRTVGMLWLYLGLAGLLFRMVQLTIQDDLTTALTWGCKIITDPYHDIKMYHRSPLYVLRGEWIDPMQHVRSH